MSLLAVQGLLDYVNWIVTSGVIVVLSLITICLSSLTIGRRLNCRVPGIDTAHNRQCASEQNTKLSRTLFIVIGASLVCWFPSIDLYCIHYLCFECIPLSLVHIFSYVFRLANCVVNPVI